MRSLYIRIYVTVVAALALFALVSGLLLQNHLDRERALADARMTERIAPWAELLQRSLPGGEASVADQAAALQEWSDRLRLPMALEDADGRRIAASQSYLRRESEPGFEAARLLAVPMDDGRRLVVIRMRPPGPPHPPPFRPPLPGMPEAFSLVALLVLLFGAVAAGAYPVVRRLTRRLEALKRGVEAFGSGDLKRRVAEDGRDEVASLGASFNQAAARIEVLLRSHQSLLANASHELRSPLARLKMAVAMMDDAPATEREALKHEIATDIAELDALVEEVLLASRLDAGATINREEPVELLAVAAEEAARVRVGVHGSPASVKGDERLLRRALRNLLENARRYGGSEVELIVSPQGTCVEVQVCDRGPGVPEAYRERIFEPFFRLPGHAEREGGVGLGLALVRQIAERHEGRVRCTPREGGGSCFTLSLPAA